MQEIHARQALTAEGWVGDLRIAIDNGRIARISTGPAEGRRSVDLLLPAPANLHSHAFQRAMAGLTETRGPDPKDSFWTWRKLMYRFLDRLTPDHVQAIAALVFLEMQEAGYGSVAEFHYLHHDIGGVPFTNLPEMAERIAADRRCSPPASTPTANPSYSKEAGVTAVPSRAMSARTQKMCRASASATMAALTSGSSVAAMAYQAPSRSPVRNSRRFSVIPSMASTAGVAEMAMTCTSAPLATRSGNRRCATVPPPTMTTFLPVRRKPTRYAFSELASLLTWAGVTRRA